jgi:hypothetical protein
MLMTHAHVRVDEVWTARPQNSACDAGYLVRLFRRRPLPRRRPHSVRPSVTSAAI